MMHLEGPFLLPYFTAGWPDPKSFVEAVKGAADAGCPAFEIGYPFSDPMADGPTIQATTQEALENGIDLEQCYSLTRDAVEASGLPAVVMTYAQLVYCQGVENFCDRIARSGAQALIVADLPDEESYRVAKACEVSGINLISFCAPTTSAQRRERIVAKAQGFLYLVAAKGVTGERSEIASELPTLIREVKKIAKCPVCAGFGLSKPKQVAKVLQWADGAIVGSAILKKMRENRDQPMREVVKNYIEYLMQGVEEPIC